MLQVRVQDRDIFSLCSVHTMDHGSRQSPRTCHARLTVLYMDVKQGRFQYTRGLLDDCWRVIIAIIDKEHLRSNAIEGCSQCMQQWHNIVTFIARGDHDRQIIGSTGLRFSSNSIPRRRT